MAKLIKPLVLGLSYYSCVLLASQLGWEIAHSEPHSSVQPLVLTAVIAEEQSFSETAVRISCAGDVLLNVTDTSLETACALMNQQQQQSAITPATLYSNSHWQLASGSGGSSEWYTPFLLQNRTGLALQFWTHTARVESVAQVDSRNLL